jgi:hypothetical protein
MGLGWDRPSWAIRDDTAPKPSLMRQKNLLKESESNQSELNDCTYGLSPLFSSSVCSYSTLYSTDKTTITTKVRVPKSQNAAPRELLHDEAPSCVKILCNILQKDNRVRAWDLKFQSTSNPSYTRKWPQKERLNAWITHTQHSPKSQQAWLLHWDHFHYSTKPPIIVCPNAWVVPMWSRRTTRETPHALRVSVAL